MFKHIAKLDGKYVLRRLGLFGWEYYDFWWDGGCWWPLKYGPKNASRFDDPEDVKAAWLGRKKNKPKSNKPKSHFTEWL